METANNAETSNSRSRRPILIVALLAIMAAAVGITLAYLANSSDPDNPVTNIFNSNHVKVELNEEAGQDFSIVPGGTATKDPLVKVDTTVDAYVFLLVTASEGIDEYVAYSLLAGDGNWIFLEDSSELVATPGGIDAHAPNTLVYYREVKGSSSPQEFKVLADDKVSFSTKDKDPDFSELTLTFQAHAIQKEPFNDPVKAWNQEAIASGDEDAPTAIITTTETGQEGIETVVVSANAEYGAHLDIPSFRLKPTYSLCFALSEGVDPDKSPYSNWDADFTVSFNKPIIGATLKGDQQTDVLGQIVFYGNYGDYGNVPLVLWNRTEPSTEYELPAGSKYRLLKDGLGVSMTYAQLKKFNVSPFNCGVTVKSTDDRFVDENGNRKGVQAVYPNGMISLDTDVAITLELRLYDPADESNSICCATATYLLPAG